MSIPLFWISAGELADRVGTARAPVLFDTCRAEAFDSNERIIAGAKWRDLQALDCWAAEIPPGAEVAVNCLHGHQMSQSAVARLRHRGVNARVVEGGLHGFMDAGGITVAKSDELPAFHLDTTRWVTRADPKVGSIACCWFVRRFIDRTAEILFVQTEWAGSVATELNAVPFDILGADFGHDGDTCSFDAFLDRFCVDDSALRKLARIVRGAETGRLDLEPETAGLLALSRGLSAANSDDLAALQQGMAIFDALYCWCRNTVADSQYRPAQMAGR